MYHVHSKIINDDTAHISKQWPLKINWNIRIVHALKAYRQNLNITQKMAQSVKSTQTAAGEILNISVQPTG